MQKRSIVRLAQLALLVALEVVLSRFLSISTPIVKIGFAFVPVVLAAMLHGPVAAMVVGALADFLGAVIFPFQGAYFPGFTVTAALVGLTYGLFLYPRTNVWRTIAAVLIITVLLHLGLNTLWVAVLYNKGFLALLPTRVLQCVLMAPVQIIVIQLLNTVLKRYNQRKA